jgi:hypothetical protein
MSPTLVLARAVALPRTTCPILISPLALVAVMSLSAQSTDSAHSAPLSVPGR